MKKGVRQLWRYTAISARLSAFTCYFSFFQFKLEQDEWEIKHEYVLFLKDSVEIKYANKVQRISDSSKTVLDINLYAIVGTRTYSKFPQF